MRESIFERFAKRQRRTRLTAILVGLVGATAACGEGGSIGPGSGRLAITITGLPPTVPASVTVVGPGGFQFVTGASRTLGALDPGSYTVTAAEVTSGGSRYAPTPATQTVLVTSGALATATPITYAVTSARVELALELVVDGLIAPVFLTAPEGDARQLVVERNGRIRILENGILRPT